jgi:hypothetical protein
MAQGTIQYQVSLNGSGGAYTSLVAKGMCRRLEIVEDDAATRQGLQYQLPDDTFATTYAVAATAEPLVLGQEVGKGLGHGSPIGLKAQTDPAGRSWGGNTMIKLKSLSATATTINVKEVA